VSTHINPMSMQHVRDVFVKVSPEGGEYDDAIGHFDDFFESFHEVRLEMDLGVVFGRVEYAVDVEEDDGAALIFLWVRPIVVILLRLRLHPGAGLM